jgi:hypothetical protein
MGDIIDLHFRTQIQPNIYQVGFYVADLKTPEIYKFQTIQELNKTHQLTPPTRDNNHQNIADILPHIVSNTFMKNSSKNLYLTCLLFVIIGNSSIYYYFEQVNPKEFGVFNIAFKIAYHCIGFIFLVKTLQYVWYTCRASHYIDTLNGFNHKLVNNESKPIFNDLDTKSNQVKYIIDPFSVGVVNIIPVSVSKYDITLSTLDLTVTEDDVQNAKKQLVYEKLFPAVTSKTKTETNYESIKWLTFISSVIIVCILATHATLYGIPIYGVLHYYNPFACFNLSGFYTLLKSLWKKDDGICDGVEPSQKGGESKESKTCNPLDHLKNKTIEECSKFFRTYNGVGDHLLFDAFKLRSVKVYKNTNILNVFFQFMYIYNCATIFINPLSILMLFAGLGYVPATPSYFVSGNATIEAMKKSIKLPFYKKWLFYFTQGRCYKSNIMTGVFRRFMTMGVDVWNMDTIFNNDTMKLVCNYRKYFKVAGILCIIIVILNYPSILRTIISDIPTGYHMVSLIINIIAIVVYIVFIKKSNDNTYSNIYEYIPSVENDDITNYVNSYKNKTPINLLGDTLKACWEKGESGITLVYHLELIFGIATIIILHQSMGGSTIKKIGIPILIILLFLLIVAKNKGFMNLINSEAINKKIKDKITHNISHIRSVIEVRRGVEGLIDSKSEPNILKKLKELEDNLNRTTTPLLEHLEKLQQTLGHSEHKTIIEDHTLIIKDLEKLKTELSDSSSEKHINKAIRAAKMNKNILSKDHSEKEIWDIHTNINHSTNLYTTIVLNVVDEWTKDWTRFFWNKKSSKHTGSKVIPMDDTGKNDNEGPDVTNFAVAPTHNIGGGAPQKQKDPPLKIVFNTPGGNLIRDSRSNDTIEHNNEQPHKESNEQPDKESNKPNEPIKIEGQKYSDWTQFFTGGSEYEDKSLFLTSVKCGGRNNANNNNAETKKEVCKKIDNKSPDGRIGIISISSDDFNTLLKNTATQETDDEICNKLYRNKPRCINVVKYYQNVATNSDSKMILELDVTNNCTGEAGTEVELDEKIFSYRKVFEYMGADPHKIINHIETRFKSTPEPITEGDQQQLGKKLEKLMNALNNRDTHIMKGLVKHSDKLKDSKIGRTLEILETILKKQRLQPETPIVEPSVSSAPSQPPTPPQLVGGNPQEKNIFSNFTNEFVEHRASGKEYYVPVEYLDYAKGIKYKINDLLIDPVHNKIKIYGTNTKYEYSDSKIRDLVSVYLDEREEEEVENSKASSDDKLKQQMSYDEYVRYSDAKDANKPLATDMSNQYMTGGNKLNKDFKERFRDRFKEVVQDQNIIETFLKENKNKVSPSKYDNIMRMDNRPVIIKTGLKERYITTSGELLSVKPKNPDRDFVDVVTLGDEPMKINVSGKECYMTKDGSLINVRQNKNIYKRKKTFKKKRR